MSVQHVMIASHTSSCNPLGRILVLKKCAIGRCMLSASDALQVQYIFFQLESALFGFHISIPVAPLLPTRLGHVKVSINMSMCGGLNPEELIDHTARNRVC